MNSFRKLAPVWLTLMVAGSITLPSWGASVTASGYTNDFAVQPTTADWTTYSMAGAGTDFGTDSALDAGVQNVAAATISGQVAADGANPPAANASAVWSSSGFYLATKPTGNAATLLMCRLVNGLSTEVIGATLSYNQTTSTGGTPDQIPGHRAFYSFSGAAGSWVRITQFSGAADGRLTATLTFNWPSSGTLYLLWADDNADGGTDNDIRIDNFSVQVTPGVQTPVAITSHPQSQTVDELQPVDFSVSVQGYPAATFQWYTNDTAVVDGTNASLAFASVPLAYHGMQIKVIAQNVVSNVTYYATSTVATLTVTADTIRPALLGAFATGPNQLVAFFSEPLDLASATSTANYGVTGPGGASVIISNVVLDVSLTNVFITVSPMTAGSNYTLTVNNVTDRSAAANAVLPNSQAIFTAASLNIADIGTPSVAGSAIPTAGGYTVSGGGTNIAGAADQFFFAYQPVVGDFDQKIRIESLTLADAWAKAGLMARETLLANSRFAMSVATPSLAGCYFMSRLTTGASATSVGQFPVNYPSTWVRLARTGNEFRGYGSFDGQTWVLLGSVTLASAPSTMFVGMAVSGSTTNGAVAAVATFREQGSGAGGTVVPGVDPGWEPLGPATRNTGLIISEIMYHPKLSNDLEFIEVFNAGLIQEDLSGCRIAGDVEYVFPPNTRLPVGAFLVVARNPALLQQAYGISGVHGPWIGAETNALPDNQGTIRLRYRHRNAILLEVNYQGAAPWPLAADGSGHSLVLARPSYGQGNPQAWAASDKIGGSPGRMENFNSDPIRNVVINEFMANSPLPQEDYIELYNHGTQPVDLFGAYLSDDRDTNKFRITSHVLLPSRGFRVFSQTELGFGLSAGGERIYLVNSNQNRVIDLVAFDGQAPGVASGRYPDGAPAFHELAAQTPGGTNAPLLIRDIVINEIMFNPISGDDEDQYVELYNRGTNAVNLSEWQFRDGIDYVFPAGTVIAARSYLAVGRNVPRLLSKYPQLNGTNLVGNFDGRLSHGGERIALYMPEYVVSTNTQGALVTNVNWMVADEVTYVDSGRWTRWADGGGSSLELIDPNSDNRLVANWADSDETQKSAWTNIVHSGLLDHVYMRDASGNLMDEVQVMLLGGGEALMDDVLVQAGGPGTLNPNRVVNSSFDGGIGSWLIQGNHVRSGLEPVGPNNPSQCLRIRATAGGDNGANRVECDLTAALTPNTEATISGRFRWLRGFPIVLMRVHGGGIEAVGTLPTPPNLGSPALPNSRMVANAGPAVYAVTHNPVLPAASQPVVVSARVGDPDRVGSVTLKYRLDPSAALTTLAMRDDGTGGDTVAGDGLYAATILGQAASTLVAFHVTATDAHASPATTLFPADAPAHECLVRFGDPEIFGNLGVYRLWMTTSNYNTWRDRERLSNEPQDGTFVYGRLRAIYNAGARYRGSPFTRNPGSPLATGANFVWTLPDDDLLLDTDELNIDSLEPTGRDATALRELTAFTMADQLGLSFSYQRFIRPVINGTPTPSPISTDSQQPNGEYTAMWFPEVEEGDLYKVDDWFEFADTLTGSAGTGMQGNKSASLDAFTTTMPDGRTDLKQARYRWNWEKKFNRGLNDDYSSLFAAVKALTEPNNALYPSQVDAIFETEEWLTALALRHVLGDWDGYGYNRGKNQFIYRPAGEKISMLLWDLDFSIGCTGGHGPTQDLFTVAQDGLTGQNHMPEVARMYNHPYFRRIYMQALLRMADTVLADSAYMPILDARYRALTANGVPVTGAPATGLTSPYVGSGAQGISLPAWIQQRRTYIYQQMASASNVAFAVTSPTSMTSGSNSVTLTGNAPLWVQTIRVNGVDYRFNWSSVTAWNVVVPIGPGTSQLVVQPYDRQGELLSGSVTVNATFSGSDVDPRGVVVFNEIMHQPAVPDTEYVELFNTSATATFDVSGWRINGLDYTFPAGSYMAPRSYLVLAKDPHAFLAAYGSGSAVFGQYAGNLQSDGETLTLIKPGATADLDVVVDKVRYEGALPWSTDALRTGSSLQLVDADQDNSRAGNWASRFDPSRWTDPVYFYGYTNTGWRFVQTNANMVTVRAVTQAAVTNVVEGVTNIIPAVTNDVGRLLIYLGFGQGEVYMDDLRLVIGTNINEGPNLIRNGDFESPLLEDPTVVNSFFVSTNMTNSVISTDLKHEGNSSLRLVQGRTASQTNLMIFQHVFPAPTNGTLCTLSFWYYVNENTPPTNTLIVRFQNSSLNGTTNYGPVVTPPSYTPPQLISPATNYLSPGRGNHFTAALPPIPPIWLNEVLTLNVAGIQDAAGHRGPWIELHNTGTNQVLLEGLYLSDSYTNLTQWAFPAGSAINPGEFKIIFADGAVGETASNEWHTSFVLGGAAGSIALSRLYNGEPQVLDYINYEGLQADWSYGSFPNGQPFDRMIFTVPTPGASNAPSPALVRINEWLASNVNPGGYPDPLDGQYDDWFELYNAGPNAANLSGYYLTDDPAAPAAWRIPDGTVIPPHGFLLVWADGQTGQNGQGAYGDLHAPFRLDRDGDYIGLFANHGGSLVEIDSMTFGFQESNISEGRYPDGSDHRQALTTLTPRASNVAGNTAPVITPIADLTITPGQTVAFSVVATDAQVPPQFLAYSLVANPGGIPTPPGGAIDEVTGIFQWTAPAVQAPSTNLFTVRVQDSGTPSLASELSFRILVVLAPSSVITPPAANGDLTLSFGAIPGKHYRVEFKAELGAESWTVLADNVLATGPTLSFTDNIANGPQRFYRVVLLD